MSPVFRHGSLRLYLLRLLDEEPRHGYEVIRLLRDRFMGVYSPSPGTIYPRLARLEEEGLVTHDEVDGRKVYRITEAGRDELRSRSDELDELEEELSASVSNIVREVREDVRQTVRSLREELTWAARESRRVGRDATADVREQTRQARGRGPRAGQAGQGAGPRAGQAGEGGCPRAAGPRGRPAGARAGPAAPRGSPAGPRRGPGGGLAGSASPPAPGSMPVSRTGTPRAGGRSGWSQGPGWTDWPGRRGWEDWARSRTRNHGPGWTGPLDFGTLRDLERLAVQFTADLRKLATQSSAAGENVISDLRTILEDALERIKSEIFGPGREPPTDDTENPAQTEKPAQED